MPRYASRHGVRDGGPLSADDAAFLQRVSAVRETARRTRQSIVTVVCSTCGPLPPTEGHAVHVVQNVGHVVTFTEITSIIYKEGVTRAAATRPEQ